ncbi:MAG: MurT ligase domain-containing protein [Candidatus Daviesbacteria bacterium]|nr:MurT ligase domain-containing protein [Candidatus Daviesbacteria bacterium]
MQTLLAILTGKVIAYLSRILKLGGGSAAPGLYALKIDHNLVKRLAKQIPKTIIITGTNGKTTTAKMLAHFVQTQDFKVIRNSTGSNLERGIASTLISRANLLGKLAPVDLAIWELDEAAFNTLAPKLNPDIIVFLNAFRDQLDRYGEVDTVVNHWQQTLEKIDPSTTLIINGDDKNTASLKRNFTGKTIVFGLENYRISGEGKIQTELKTDLQAKKIKNNGLSGTEFEVLDNKVKLNLPGVYQIYNLLAALGSSIQLGIDISGSIKSLSSFSAAFGRVEKISLGAKEAYIMLIKNPVGATQVFATISPNLNTNDELLIALNDNFADGTDVSWIWDANFENLKSQMLNVKCICSGTRAYELALRLKYAGFNAKNLIVESNLSLAFKLAKASSSKRLFILPTYTAMLQLQHLLTSSGVKKHYWRES